MYSLIQSMFPLFLLLMIWSVVGYLTEDVEVDVESIVFDCVDSDGLSITHTEADHCYSSIDKAWLWRRWGPRWFLQHHQVERKRSKHSKKKKNKKNKHANRGSRRMDSFVTVQLNPFLGFFLQEAPPLKNMSNRKLSVAITDELCPFALRSS